MVVGADRGELLAGLATLAEGCPGAGVVVGRASSVGKTVLVFGGQGSQWVGIGAELLDSSAVFAEQMHRCDKALGEYVPWSLIDVIRADQEHHEYSSPAQGDDQIEDAFQREIIPDEPGQESSAHVPCMIKRFIAAHALCELCGAYKSQGDCGNGGWKDRGCTPDQDLRCEHTDQCGLCDNPQTADSDDSCSGDDHPALVA